MVNGTNSDNHQHVLKIAKNINDDLITTTRFSQSVAEGVRNVCARLENT